MKGEDDQRRRACHTVHEAHIQGAIGKTLLVLMVVCGLGMFPFAFMGVKMNMRSLIGMLMDMDVDAFLDHSTRHIHSEADEHASHQKFQSLSQSFRHAHAE